MPLRYAVNVGCAGQKERIGRGQPHATSQRVVMFDLFTRTRLELQSLHSEHTPASIDNELASLRLSMQLHSEGERRVAHRLEDRTAEANRFFTELERYNGAMTAWRGLGDRLGIREQGIVRVV